MTNPLNFDRLKQFEKIAAVPDDVKTWPSREPQTEGQFTIRARLDVIERFRNICKNDRRTYGAMLEILINEFDKRKQNE
jgi:uncharacterized protein (DUF4415 family)